MLGMSDRYFGPILIRTGPRYLMVAARLGKIEAHFKGSRRPSGKLAWTPNRLAEVRTYLERVRAALSGQSTSELKPAWGGEGRLASWGRLPTDRDAIAEDLIWLETGLHSLISSSNNVRLLRGEGNVLTHGSRGDASDGRFASVVQDLSAIEGLLVRGEYLEEASIQRWRSEMVALGGAFPRSFFELAAPSSPTDDADRDYWQQRNAFHMTCGGRELFEAHDGERWTSLFLLNFWLCDRFEKDEVMVDEWKSAERDPKFESYVRAGIP